MLRETKNLFGRLWGIGQNTLSFECSHFCFKIHDVRETRLYNIMNEFFAEKKLKRKLP